MTEAEHRLRESLAEFDGRALTLLGEAEAQFGGDPDYVDALIVLAADRGGAISAGATWLLKSALEKGRTLSVPQVQRLCGQLTSLTAWDAQLHICQCLANITVPADCGDALAEWLIPLLGHKRPFVRAWALDGLYRLSAQHQEHREAFDDAIADAEQDSAASVRARARNLRRLQAKGAGM